MVIGMDSQSKTLFLIDFGLAKTYLHNGRHIPFAKDKGKIGTSRYASLNAQKGYEQSRRDDLESLGYSFIYLIKGRLPWQGLVVDND